MVGGKRGGARGRISSWSTSVDSSPSPVRDKTVTDVRGWDVHSPKEMGDEVRNVGDHGALRKITEDRPYRAGAREEQEYERLTAAIADLLDLRERIPAAVGGKLIPSQPTPSSSSSAKEALSTAPLPPSTTLGGAG